MRPLIISGHDRPVTQLLYNVDGDLFFSSSDGGSILVYWTFPFELTGSIKIKTAVKTIDVTRDAKLILHAGLHVGMNDVETGSTVLYKESTGSNRFTKV
jgi:translation initiation factor 3 subunit I